MQVVMSLLDVLVDCGLCTQLSVRQCEDRENHACVYMSGIGMEISLSCRVFV